MCQLTPPPKEAIFPKGLFLSQAWIFAGDTYFEAQRTFGDFDVAIPHQEGEELKMSQEVVKEVYREDRICICFSSTALRKGPSLPRIVDKKWETNLLAAVECYSKAVSSFEDEVSRPSRMFLFGLVNFYYSEGEYTEDEDSENEGSGSGQNSVENQQHASAFRKKGFACHEYGRRLAELGWHAKDETDKFFRKAIREFRKGNDLPNFELALCSRIEYHRKLAEFRVTQQGPEGRIKTMEEARVKFQEALDLSSEAKKRLKKWGGGQHKEVDTEEAHTYLKLGKFLTIAVKQNREGQISAEEALHEAINLYIKLDRKEEVAYARFQLGCVLRDRMVFEPVNLSDVTRLEKKLTVIWVKALEYYCDVRDTDMCLRIRMEHSELYLGMRRKAHVNKGLDQALILLLEGCHVPVFNGSSVCEEFIRKLLELLLTMCMAAKSHQNIATSSNLSKVNNYELLAQMYKCVVKLKGGNDYHFLCSMWDNYAIAKSQN